MARLDKAQKASGGTVGHNRLQGRSMSQRTKNWKLMLDETRRAKKCDGHADTDTAKPPCRYAATASNGYWTMYDRDLGRWLPKCGDGLRAKNARPLRCLGA
jgi:hypothetical protein